MKPVNFKHANTQFAKDQDEYNTLPALRIDGPEGHVISCWKMSFKERLIVLFTGRVWLNLMSFNKPLTPSYMSVVRKKVFTHPDDDKGTLLNRIFKLLKGDYILLMALIGLLSILYLILRTN